MRTLSKLSFLQWRNTIYQGVLLQSVYGQLPPRSWSTIGCQYSPQSLSSAATRIHHELPPQSRSSTTTAIRCQHDRGSAIFVMTSQHDTESAILDPPLRSLIREFMDEVREAWNQTNVSKLENSDHIGRLYLPSDSIHRPAPVAFVVMLTTDYSHSSVGTLGKEHG